MAEPQNTDTPQGEQTPVSQSQTAAKPQPPAKKSKAATALFVITIVVCVILIPILIMNTVMIVQIVAKPDKAPSLFGYVPRMIAEDDFEPDIMEGDIIFAKVTDPSEVEVGDTILFFGTSSQNKDKIIIQKVTTLVYNDDGSLKGWQTHELGKEYKGEENATTTFTVPTNKLVGVYKGASIPKLAHFMLFMQTIPGMLICVGVPLALIIGYELIRERKEKKKNKENTAALMAELEALRALQSQSNQETDGEDTPPKTDDT